MKKIPNILKAITSSLLTLCMVFGLFFNAGGRNVNKVKANASNGTSSSYSTEYYTLTYANNEIKLLLNSNLGVYQNFTRSDLTELKNSLVSVAYDAILDDVSLSSETNQLKRAVRRLPSDLNDIDVSSIGNIIAGQLVDYESIDNALAGTYDVFIDYYLDRYVDLYLQENQDAIAEDVLDAVAEKLTQTLQDTINTVYENNGELEYAPNVENKIGELADAVQQRKENGQSAEISLNDVVDIIKIINDKTALANVINELDTANEIKSIIKNSADEEIVNFFTAVDMDTIIDLFGQVNIDNTDVKEIIADIGMDNIIEIVSTIGMDQVIELANAVHFTEEDLREAIKQTAPTVSLNSLLKSINSITIDDSLLYENNEFKLAGIKNILKNFPRPSEIANYTDEQMKITWNLKMDTIFGNVDFDLTVGFFGDCSLIRSAANEIAQIVDFQYVDGTYQIQLNIPEKFDNILLRICNSNSIPDHLKTALFDTAFGTIEELYTKITNKTLDGYIEILKEIDYQTILANLYNADNLNKLFNTTQFTDARLDKFVDEVCAMISRIADLTYDQMKNFVSKYVDLSSFDDAAIEKLVNEALTLFRKIDALSLDSALLREFIDPDSIYTNENIYQYIDKLSNYENYFNRLMDYFTKWYEAIPDRLKDNTIMDFYRGNGKFSYSGTINLNIEKLLTTISSTYGQTIYDALSVLFDRLPTQVSVNLTAEVHDMYQITYHYGEETKSGVLPVGADVAFFSNVTEIDGFVVQKWIDAQGVEYTTMPNQDIELFAVTEFDAYIENGVEKVYDGEVSTLTVITNPVNNYTYQWYKDGVAIENATESTLTVVNVADSGSYTCEVSLPEYSVLTEAVDVIISKAQIDVSSLAWDYDSNAPYTYDGNAKNVTLDGVPAHVIATYSGDKDKVDAGSYTTTVTLTPENDNYELVGNTTLNCTWTIDPQAIDVSNYQWNYTGPFTYDGQSKKVELTEFSDLLTPTYNGNTATDANSYVASVTFTVIDSVNYTISGSVVDCAWTIDPQTIDVSSLAWDYDSNAPYTYDGNAKNVTLDGVPAHVIATYSGDKDKVDAGSYTTTVTLTPENSNYELSGNTTLNCTWTIDPQTIDISSLAWDYDSNTPYTYDGNAKNVTLDSVPAHVIATYSGDKDKTDAGSYTTTVTLTPENSNYELVGNTILNCTWTIDPAEFDLSTLSWDYSSSLKYDGTVKTVTLSNVPTYLQVTYAENSKTEIGKYHATAIVTSTDKNYVTIGAVAALDWEIVAAGTSVKTEFTYEENGVLLAKVVSTNGIDATNSITFQDKTSNIGEVDFSDVEKDKDVDLLAAYGISFVDANGQEISYNDRFKVWLLIPENLRTAANLTVYQIADNGTVSAISAERDGDYFVIETNELSTYLLASVSEKEISQNNWWIWLLLALLLIIIILLIIFLGKNKKTPVPVVIAPAPAEDTSMYLIIDKNGNIVEQKLDTVQDNDIVGGVADDTYAIGKSDQGQIQLFKDKVPLKYSLGKTNDVDGELSINLYKEPVLVMDKDENR